MRILALDTATTVTAVGLLDTARTQRLRARDVPEPGARPGHASTVLVLIEQLLEESGAGWEGIDRIAVGVGPGTFTGLRIGIATAQGLARARNIPLVGISTLHALALGALSLPGVAGSDEPAVSLGAEQARHEERIIPAVDARRSELFVAAWSATKNALASTPLKPPAVLKPDALGVFVADLSSHETPMAIGDGAVKFRREFEAAGAQVPPDDDERHVVDAINHCALAATVEPAASLEQVQPEYLRIPDAEQSRP